MITKLTQEIAKQIGEDSFDLLNFNQLPVRCSIVEQTRALKRDQEWQTDHHNEIVSRIDTLISEIRGSLHA